MSVHKLKSDLYGELIVVKHVGGDYLQMVMEVERIALRSVHANLTYLGTSNKPGGGERYSTWICPRGLADAVVSVVGKGLREWYKT